MLYAISETLGILLLSFAFVLNLYAEPKSTQARIAAYLCCVSLILIFICIFGPYIVR